MLLYGATSTRCSMICPSHAHIGKNGALSYVAPTRVTNAHSVTATATATAAAALVLSVVFQAGAIEPPAQQPESETLSNIPQTLSGVCTPDQKDCKKRIRIQKPKSRKAESCTSKCVTTCTQGGYGSPGEGPLNIRRPLVVFKDGFRSRKYCLAECSDICNLIGDGDDGP